MGAAFKCDLCDTLQEGTPVQTVGVSPRSGPTTQKQLCTGCNVSFNDWLASRAPEYDKPGVPA